MTEQRMALDVLGQFFASTFNPYDTGSFSVTVHLNEPLDPNTLQQAVNDLMRRLPFLSGRLRRGFFGYWLEALAEPPQIVPAENAYAFRQYYKKKPGHMLQVQYGPRHFTAQVTHALCDGRSVSRIASALLVRYFELLGVAVPDKGNVLDCADQMQPEEMENCYERFGSIKKPEASMKQRIAAKKTYQPQGKKLPRHRVTTKVFDAGEVKAAAKAHGATVNEYLMAHVFLALARERRAMGKPAPIVISVPIDCRGFFPTKSMRNFVSDIKIPMPDSEDFAEVVQEIRGQLAQLSAEGLQAEISAMQQLYHKARWVPRCVKRVFMVITGLSEVRAQSTGLSNLGVVKLPAEIEPRVDHMEFVIESDPLYFSCVTAGGKLALTAVASVESDTAETVFAGLK